MIVLVPPLTVLGVGATIAFGTVALPAVAIGGFAYGIWSYAGGSDWIDENWGYRETNTSIIEKQ